VSCKITITKMMITSTPMMVPINPLLTIPLLFHVLASGGMFAPPVEDGSGNHYPVRAGNHNPLADLAGARLTRANLASAGPAKECLTGRDAAEPDGGRHNRQRKHAEWVLPYPDNAEHEQHPQMIHKTIAAQSGASRVPAA
jgi:hypothetical protein